MGAVTGMPWIIGLRRPDGKTAVLQEGRPDRCVIGRGAVLTVFGVQREQP